MITAQATHTLQNDVQLLLNEHSEKQMLRFITCGSVDDGKSTLIGRLLLEAGAVYEDQIAALQQDSKRHGTTGQDIDPALLLDGLEDERQQGITIDVAYRYFTTPKRKFIIADTPGHEQFTRNMATGASTADLAVILVDASKGILTQTKRHAFIVSLLGIKHVILAVNKMDLVDFSQETFDEICSNFKSFAAKLELPDIRFVPLSALLRRQRGTTEFQYTLVRRQLAAALPRDNLHWFRSKPERLSFPCSVGESAGRNVSRF